MYRSPSEIPTSELSYPSQAGRPASMMTSVAQGYPDASAPEYQQSRGSLQIPTHDIYSSAPITYAASTPSNANPNAFVQPQNVNPSLSSLYPTSPSTPVFTSNTPYASNTASYASNTSLHALYPSATSPSIPYAGNSNGSSNVQPQTQQTNSSAPAYASTNSFNNLPTNDYSNTSSYASNTSPYASNTSPYASNTSSYASNTSSYASYASNLPTSNGNTQNQSGSSGYAPAYASTNDYSSSNNYAGAPQQNNNSNVPAYLTGL